MREQVIFPLRVDHAQHDHALVVAHGLGADELFFGVVALFELVEDGVAQFLAIHLLGLDAFGVDVDAEAGEDRVFQALRSQSSTCSLAGQCCSRMSPRIPET